jgi:hypothetical protein
MTIEHLVNNQAMYYFLLFYFDIRIRITPACVYQYRQTSETPHCNNQPTKQTNYQHLSAFISLVYTLTILAWLSPYQTLLLLASRLDFPAVNYILYQYPPLTHLSNPILLSKPNEKPTNVIASHVCFLPANKPKSLYINPPRI